MWPPPGSSKTYLLTRTHDLSPRSDLFKSCYLSKWCYYFSCCMYQTAGVMSDILSSPPDQSITKSVDCKSLMSPRFAHCLQISIATLTSCLTSEIISCVVNLHSFPQSYPQSILHIVMRMTFLKHSSDHGTLCLNTQWFPCFEDEDKILELTWKEQRGCSWPLTFLTPPASTSTVHPSLSALQPHEFSFIPCMHSFPSCHRHLHKSFHLLRILSLSHLLHKLSL